MKTYQVTVYKECEITIPIKAKSIGDAKTMAIAEAKRHTSFYSEKYYARVSE